MSVVFVLVLLLLLFVSYHLLNAFVFKFEYCINGDRDIDDVTFNSFISHKSKK